ncbi:SMC-Scp complex subunit ScpB [[Mycoplasma] mobile]|uniref:Segregation and condensation protein B n=1 Tax=Mycoplasma mobile (strain ATCC 43663 / 163K / NCTC 11711) TaxID=267748 RepID=SCPB_MYCM1|nr:SMC-Scp complex subunit ScpB [[Mycoplasma] mobile]Q6KHG8.1 RecName: Full=Segregation and condensation protein B [Mycoplasma mobile 163K]AAT27962.1 predicted transcriptional regulator [Mycoplasma mobile 163K]
MNNKIIEALIYIQGEEGLSSEQLQKVLKSESISSARALLKVFKEKWNNEQHGIKVEEFNDVYKFATIKDVKDYVSELVTIIKKQRLSNAAIEVAGIVAYKQPISKSQINKIRGVASEIVVNTLLIKGIIEEVGIAQTPGNPILYGVTAKFYDYFKIKSLHELPNLKEFDDTGEYESIEDFDLYSSQREDQDE